MEEPFGPLMEFYRTGLLASIICNALRSKGQKASKPEDFMPQGRKKKRSRGITDPAMQQAMCVAIHRGLGGK